MIRIGIDAMGGDFAPEATVKGAIDATREIAKDSKIVLFGDKKRIEKVIAENSANRENIEIVHTSEVIEMNEHPAQAFVKKSDSSISVGFRYLKEEEIDGFASAGSTGAMMVGCMQVAKEIEGVIRPAISAMVETAKGTPLLMLDVGLNVDCKPEVLYQYGMIGSIYAASVLNIKNPRVALLNIGEERGKGNILTKATYELMHESDKFNFVGNIESKHLFTGEYADVVVCDGFSGNVVLKMAEGFYELAKAEGLKIGYFEQLNYESVGGTAVLGVNANVMVAHGCSSALAIKNMILQTEQAIKGNLVERLRKAFN